MSTIPRWSWIPILLALATTAPAQHHGGAGYSSLAYYGNGGFQSFGSGGWGSQGGGGFGLGGCGYGLGSGFAVSSFYPTPIIVPGPVFVPVGVPQRFAGGQMGGGLMLPMPPQQLAAPNPRPAHRPNPARAKEQVEIGDRSFRAGNIKRAEDKYNLAVKADPTSPKPHVHLAQVSMARGDYLAAADHLRDAVTVATDGNWLLNAPDIQSIFGEPADFSRHLARLESHLQANPTDRDAWFVLGAESYLSGRSKQATDIFERLSDRRPDEALSAFTDAATPK